MSLRLFAALEVADDVRAAIVAAVEPVRERHPDLKWTPPHQWHLTIAFLGSVEEERLPEVEDALRPVAAAVAGPVRLRLGDVGHFGRRVLWIGVEDDPAGVVADLGVEAQRALLVAELPVDEKPVKPHVTLARPAKRNGKLPRAVLDEVPTVDGAWEVAEVVLLSSVRGGHGEPNRYEPVATFPLA